MTDYVPFRFYRICPEDCHTCTARECLACLPEECPKVAKPVVADTGGPTAPRADQPGRGWEYTGDWC